MSRDTGSAWAGFVIAGGAAVGKTTVAKAVAAHYDASVLPVDTVWLAVKAVTTPASHPQLHYFDPPDSDLQLPTEQLCERHIESAKAISEVLGTVLEYYRWERSPVVLEGAWATPAAAARWARRYEALRAVFIHEPEADEVLAAMLLRSGRQSPTRRQQILSEVCWHFGNWVREQAVTEGFPVVEARPSDTLAQRVLAAIDPD